uniref:NADH-ubiquinone oxidoreductase chain 6 n=1 Tax=Tapena vasava TaxID=1006002 RepID=I1SSH9_TAPVA|nr:NADH dehydrogenase subunit 6 [Ctenoptilum vasava]AEB71609.1 NADH dehydrogenase subunit 6 [Ctenoptilum vasava]
MIKLILYSIMIFISFIMFILKHPLSMGLMILIQTLLICLISGLYIYTYWFSYILFLTFLGGLLVLFIYVSSIASNEMFYFSINIKLFMLYIFFLLMLIFFIMNFKMNWLNLSFNYFKNNNLFDYLLFINNNNNINLTKLYNKQNYLMMFMMIIYLFITLVAVVKITNIFYGPLRSN